MEAIRVAQNSPSGPAKQGYFVLSGRSQHLVDGAVGKDMGTLRENAETKSDRQARRGIGDVGNHQRRPIDFSAARQADRVGRGDRFSGSNVEASSTASSGSCDG